jgi:hypothetical protein
MNLEQYLAVPNNDHTVYTFYSEGSNGRIEKVVSYHRIKDSQENLFNLSFGDWNNEINDVDYLAISNNNDLEKILATVASTVVEFLQLNPTALIYAEGATPSRTRLYQMKIASHWSEIGKLLHVYGWTDNQWKPFQKGVNYEAFMAEIK